MKKFIMTCLLTLCIGSASADSTYEGTWVTTNVPLDGTMTAVVSEKGHEKWHAKFYGVWHGRRFSYDVDFEGPPDKLVGKATIDGAKYTWTGSMDPKTPGRFKGSFTGNRYTGSFDLKSK